jgi:hypothetical protein
MKFVPSAGYERIDQTNCGDATADAWISRSAEDSQWDDFLLGTPLGQFQQAAMWARAKRIDGWLPIRVLLTVEDEIVGGFQILKRSSWWGKYGYVSKGPVIVPENNQLAQFASDLLQKVCRREGLRALVVLPPDDCKQMGKRLAADGFSLNILQHIDEATWLIDTSEGFEIVEQGMHKQTRKKVRQAISRGLTARQGGREDLQTFFDLMVATCRQQGVSPNPPTVDHLYALWDACGTTEGIRLFFSEHEGKALSGLLCIVFGERLSAWKRGWSQGESERHPSDLVQYEGVKWACNAGYRFVDFCSLQKNIAFEFLTGKLSPWDHSKTRYLFNVRFGGEARLLPEARVYFPNSLARLVFRSVFSKKLRQAEKTCKEAALIRGEIA